MFTSTIKRVGTISTVIIGGAIGIALTFGNLGVSQAVDIWRKDVSGIVRVFPTNLQINVGTSQVTMGTTTTGVLTEGGTALASTTSGTTFGALSESQMLLNSVITLTPNVSSATSTLPATSTLTTLLATAGQSRSWHLINGTSTSAIRVGIAAGTGINLTSNTLNNVQIQPDGYADLTCVRLTNTDVHRNVDITVEGD